jgi:hypothetical protein
MVNRIKRLTFDVIVLGHGSEKRLGSIDRKGGDDGTPISVWSDVVLTVYEITADRDVP